MRTRRHHRLRGQAFIEFLLALPLLLLILFLIMSFGKGFRVKQRAVVGSRHAAWHLAQTGRSDDLLTFQTDFFYGDTTGSYGDPRTGPGSGKTDYAYRLNLSGGAMTNYWQDRSPHLSGVTVRRAAVDYVPTSGVYRYTLQRIGETTARETRQWYYNECNFWRFFGNAIVQAASDRRPDLLGAFDQAGQQGLNTIDDPVMRDEIITDMGGHRRRLDTYYGGWIGSWRRG